MVFDGNYPEFEAVVQVFVDIEFEVLLSEIGVDLCARFEANDWEDVLLFTKAAIPFEDLSFPDVVPILSKKYIAFHKVHSAPNSISLSVFFPELLSLSTFYE